MRTGPGPSRALAVAMTMAALLFGLDALVTRNAIAAAEQVAGLFAPLDPRTLATTRSAEPVRHGATFLHPARTTQIVETSTLPVDQPQARSLSTDRGRRRWIGATGVGFLVTQREVEQDR